MISLEEIHAFVEPALKCPSEEKGIKYAPIKSFEKNENELQKKEHIQKKNKTKSLLEENAEYYN